MSLKPKLRWVAEEEAAHHRKLKNLMGGRRLVDEFFCLSDPETRTTNHPTYQESSLHRSDHHHEEQYQYQTAWNIAAHSAPVQQWWETQKLQVHTGLQGCTHSWHLCRQLSREMLFWHHLLLNIVPMLWCLRASWELKTHCPEWKAKSEWKREKQNFPKLRFQLHKILSRIQLETETTQKIKAKIEADDLGA